MIFLLFKLPDSPGTDISSKFIAHSQEVVDAVTTTILDVPKGTYVTTYTRFPESSECDALYVPRSSSNTSLPSVGQEI